MNKLQLYLTERYQKSHWHLHSLSYARFDVGESFEQDVKELQVKGMIQPVPGLNGWLIEIIDWETKWI